MRYDFREFVLGLQKVYQTLSRGEKTQWSNDVVQWVHKRGGRFLARDNRKSPWYVATPEAARVKASQALRDEGLTPEGRALKKAKAKISKR